ncbi:signal peptidase I [Faecalibacter macacae]|uniref:Signal peptidase I n=1 Tax=Faecalibacter macacae TaxID=1859289 RepID=A0A3L9M1M6_9FLAO|nr:signal peptidase I [Faecalibacter macacae]RLZ06681.1 signal peptidase I [Faecalibacter macacae]
MSLIIYWIIGFVLYNILFGAGTWKLFKNAGKPAWSAFVPFLNIWNGLQIIDRPKWWIILFYLPIVGPIFWLVMYVDLADSYGKIELKDKIIMVLTLGLYIFAINYSDNPKYLGAEKRTSTIVSSLLFALVLATLVHNWFIQPMIVPTGSMENTIKIGDALFVEKVSFGARVPSTPLGIPFSEFINRDAFVDKARLPYMRLPGWRDLKSNDIVVFNYPTDSVYSAIDRKDAYVKRLVGMPGETVEISNGILYVDGKKFQPKLDALVQHSYKVVSKIQLSPAVLYQDFGLIPTDYQGTSYQEGSTFVYGFPALTEAHVTAFKNNSNIISVEPALKAKGEKTERIRYGNQIDSTYTIFPVNKNWNEDQYGKLYIPKKGDIVDINKETLPQYINVIRKYEQNTLRVDSANGKFDIFVNDQKVDKYEIKQNYYFMVGDNRNQSLDARFFGYVPEDHIVGRPILIWANMNGLFEQAPKKFIWDRWFTSINNDNPNKTSYGIYVLIAFIGWIGYDIWKARKEKQKNKY